LSAGIKLKTNFPLCDAHQYGGAGFLLKVKHPLYGPIIGLEGSRRLRLPDFETIGT
jgi:hypothetical protein